MVTLTTVRKWLLNKVTGSPQDLPDDGRAYPCPVDRSPEIEQALCNYRITTF